MVASPSPATSKAWSQRGALGPHGQQPRISGVGSLEKEWGGLGKEWGGLTVG